MSRHKIYSTVDESFICGNCGKAVAPAESGTRNRNHCPWCLYSRHVDLCMGDRRSGCKGMMEPIGIWVKGRGEWAVIHRCISCGQMRTNRVAGDDNEMLLVLMAAKPLMSMPFPADLILRETGVVFCKTGGKP